MSALRLLAEHYGDADLTADGIAAHFVTVGEDGWPHAAMLSAGEVVVRGDGCCAVALWEGTRTTANLLRTGQATLLVVLDEHAVRAQMRLMEAECGASAGTVRLRCYVGTVESAVAETAPYARLIAGTQFVVNEPHSVLPRWRSTRRALHLLLD